MSEFEVPEVSATFRGRLGLGVILGVALVLGVMEIRHIQEMSSTAGTTLFALLPFLINIGLLVAGYVLWKSHFEGDEILHVAGWIVAGTVVLGLLAVWTITHQNIRGRPFAHGPFVTVNNMSVGGLMGFVLGWYRVNSRRHQRDIEDERARIEFLNRLLRHNILNGMQIIRGYANQLDEHVAESGQPYLTIIRDRSDEIVRFVDGVRSSGISTLDQSGDSHYPVNLSAVLETEVESARDDFEQAEFSLSVSDDACVLADDFVNDLFKDLLSNAVHHNQTDTPSVTVTTDVAEETVVVTVADNGPGIPDDEKEQVLDWNVTGSDSSGTGVGLAIAATLAERYEGTLWLEDNEPEGTRVNVELPRAGQ